MMTRQYVWELKACYSWETVTEQDSGRQLPTHKFNAVLWQEDRNGLHHAEGRQ